MPIEKAVPALRVAQLDTTELDDQCVKLLADQLQVCFKYKIGKYDLMQLEPHLRTALYSLLFYYTMWKKRQTIGQKLLGLRFADSVSFSSPTNRQLFVLQAVLTACYWLNSTKTVAGRLWQPKLRSLDVVMKLIGPLLSSFSLLNLMIFLRQGHYHNLLHRVAGLRTVHVDANPRQRNISFDLMSRELLWHGFAETGVFFLSLINFKKLRRRFSDYVLPSEDKGCADYNSCGYCNNTPILPHEAACGTHAYCYHCVATALAEDQGAKCPVCNCPIDHIKPLRTQKVLLNASQ